MMQYADPEEVGRAVKNQFWKPKQAGDGISGVFVAYRKQDFDRVVEKDVKKTIESKTVYQVEITDDEGLTRVLPAQCTAPCYEQNVQKGDALVVVYEGEGVAKRPGHNAPKIYKVTVSK